MNLDKYMVPAILGVVGVVVILYGPAIVAYVKRMPGSVDFGWDTDSDSDELEMVPIKDAVLKDHAITCYDELYACLESNDKTASMAAMRDVVWPEMADLKHKEADEVVA